MKSVSYFADTTLPLALLRSGSSLDLKQLRQDSAHANYATCGCLIIAPALITSSLGFTVLNHTGLQL